MITLKTRTGDSPQIRKQAVGEASSSKIVPKPVPSSQAEDPRGYQIGQLRRRFSPKESTADDGSTSLVFKLKPSDPDFPFELAYLECDVRVPANYPGGRPELRVRNSNIPRGFGINVERGWDKLAMERKGATILSIVNALDKNLERFLSEEKRETVKLVAFKDTRHLDGVASAEKSEPDSASSELVSCTRPAASRYVPEESYSKEQIVEAKARRAQEVRQLEARMGRLSRFRRSADGIVFTLPIEPKRRDDLPPGLHSVNSLHLIVPLLYPLQDLKIQLNEVDGVDAEPVEALFAVKAAEQKAMSLMSHMNYLVQNIHVLAKQAQMMAQKAAAQKQKDVEKVTTMDRHVAGPVGLAAEEKPHVQVIPRPPEWDFAQEDDDSDEFSSGASDEEGGVMIRKADALPEPAPQVTEVQERGTMISFPSIELRGIEVLQVSILSISVKCERCKTVNDITGLKAGSEKMTSCKKCAMQLTGKFNPTLIHENSSRAGFIDLSGCKVADMLPSTFVPTCARCSTASQGLVSVRGESMTNVCRECHGKFTFKLPETKFLFLSPGSLAPPVVGPRRKTEKLGLHAGEPLPDRGACIHYRKSFRWFRFSCCNRVHACDKCHDGAEDHVNEWANRMICGWCSREQNYTVEACGFCGRSVIGKKGRGFWEGGKGTRDQRTMSRKDPRKYKRLREVNKKE
ncbi:CHY zinc finger domain protein [Metarhizium rileyi]|uniref:CHY zinc finger domain protein n=1 Tax=Metarhizium rileyi (strain RCEF 4871) TaxID=1649241 RepID=A0A162M6Q9_METRR|nr:CHY zinc finger domain protein [Metarhizium rileyi RCEF 4871]